MDMIVEERLKKILMAGTFGDELELDAPLMSLVMFGKGVQS